MKTKYILTSLFATFILFSCSEKKEEKKNDVDADIKAMCECFEAGKTDSNKYMECLEQNDKIRAKYKDDIKVQADYDKKLAECMK